MKESIISFETAKLAFEKGYPVFNNSSKSNFYNRRTKNLIYFGRTGQQTKEHLYGAPTQSLLQKWLREIHNTHIQVYTMERWLETGNNMEIYFEVNLKIGNNLNGISNVKSNMLEFNYYEEALEEGLQEALKILTGEELR